MKAYIYDIIGTVLSAIIFVFMIYVSLVIFH